ncbi:MAG TPA: hypothetical protein VM243_16455 [Phycisphaerae bacterium]|nr:hypothetical protein [Phycisphaerae bacterium]
MLWMDSACVAVRPVDGLFRQMHRDGVAFAYSPFRLWEWCSDACAEKMGVLRARLRGMCPSMWACVMGFDFTHAKTNEFLDRWLAHSRDGVTFHGAWTNDNGEVSADADVKGHRHDQTVACILAFEMGLPFSWDVVQYDVQNIMPLEGYESALTIPAFPTYILSNHNVKTRPHAD